MFICTEISQGQSKRKKKVLWELTANSSHFTCSLDAIKPRSTQDQDGWNYSEIGLHVFEADIDVLWSRQRSLSLVSTDCFFR